jgi:hypothetical protein
MNRLLRSLALLSALGAVSSLSVVACSDDEDKTTPTADGGTDSAATDSGSGGSMGNVEINAIYTGATKGPLACLLLPEAGGEPAGPPVQQKIVPSPTFPQKVQANNVAPGSYIAVCFIDSNGNEESDAADPQPSPNAPPPVVTIEAGKTAKIDVTLVDAISDSGADSAG